VPGARQRDTQELAHRAFVVDDEDGSVRRHPPASVSPASWRRRELLQAERVETRAQGAIDGAAPGVQPGDRELLRKSRGQELVEVEAGRFLQLMTRSSLSAALRETSSDARRSSS